MNAHTTKSIFPSFSHKFKYAFTWDGLRGANGFFSASHCANFSEILTVLFDILLKLILYVHIKNDKLCLIDR